MAEKAESSLETKADTEKMFDLAIMQLIRKAQLKS